MRYRYLLVGFVLLSGVIVLGIMAYLRMENRRTRAKLDAAKEALERRDFTVAISHLDDYLTDAPDDTSARLLAAQTARRQGKADEMTRRLRDFRQHGGSSKQADLEVSLNRIQQGDLREADEFFTRYSTQKGAQETALVMEAVLIGSLKALAPPAESGLSLMDAAAPPEVGMMLEAADLWLQLRTGKADQVAGLVWRGRVFGLKYNYPKAVEDFRAALTLDPHHVEARLFLAVAISQEAPEESFAHMRILHERFPAHASVQFYLAKGCRSNGNLAEARKLFEGMAANDPNNYSPLLELGLSDIDERKLNDAGQRLRRAYQLAPHLPETNFALSRWLLLMGKAEEAKPYLDQFEKLEAERHRKN